MTEVSSALPYGLTLMHRLALRSGRVSRIAWSLDGRYLAGAIIDDQTNKSVEYSVAVWDILLDPDGQYLKRTFSEPIRDLCFMEDASLIAVSSTTVYIWNPNDMRHLTHFDIN